MKVCWLIPSDRSGGITPVALSCCEKAAKAGHKTTMLLLATPTRIGTNNNFQVSSLGLYANAPEAPAALLRWLKDNPQDVVFFNACGEFDVVIPYVPPNTKCVYVVHDTASQYWHQALKQEQNLEAIVAVSETVANQFRHHLKQPQKLFVISNGCVFPEQIQLNVLQKNDLLFLGGDNPLKGAFDVLKLWKQLLKMGFAGKLHWFGHVSAEFKAQIERLPNSEHIHVHGHVQRDFIFSTAASSKVLLMLSRVEPFGMATIEAMSMGCVPVAWDINTGTKEIVKAKTTGLFVPLGNTQALAKTVLDVCENYQTFHAAVIEHVRSNFNAAVMWKGYESLIDRVSTLEPIERSQRGQQPTAYQPPIRRFQLLPTPLRSAIREFIGRSPYLGYWLRDLRGW